MELNARLMACSSPDAVLALVAPSLATLGRWSLAVALQRMASTAKASTAGSLQRDARFEQLLLAVQWQLGSMDAGGLSGVLSACGMLGVKPPADWLQCYWRDSGAALPQFGPKELTTTLFACSRLGLRLPGEWQNRFFRASAAALPQYDAQCFANTLYACGQLGIMPPYAWLNAFWPASTAAMPTFKPHDFSGMLNACVRMRITPPEDAMEAFWRTSVEAMRLFSAANLSKTLYACATLRLSPPEEWMEAFWRSSSEQLRRSNGQSQATVLQSSAQLDAWHAGKHLDKQSFAPPDYWLDAYYPASVERMPDYVPQDFVSSLHSLGRLGITPPKDWLQTFWRTSAEKLPEFTPRNCAITLLACAQLNIAPPRDPWMLRFWRACERKLPLFNAQDLSNTMYAVAVLSLWSSPLVPKLWERLVLSFGARSVADWRSDDHLHALQLYHVYQAAAVEQPGLLPAPRGELLAAARQSWLDQGQSKQHRARGGLLSDVASCLSLMGVEHTCERWCDRAERNVDVAIEGLEPRVALMVYNSGRVLRNGQPTGRTLLRNRTLAAHGWRVVSVSSLVWQELPTLEQKDACLRKLLAR